MKPLPLSALPKSGLLLGLCLLLLSTFSIAAENLAEKTESVDGTFCIIQVQPSKDDVTGEIFPISSAAMDTTVDTLEKRINEAGVIEAHFSIKENNIQIQFPKLEPSKTSTLLRSLVTPAKLTIHKVHPQSNKLAPLVASGEESIPGYRIYPQISENAHGVESTRHILVRRRPDLNSNDIATAWPDIDNPTNSHSNASRYHS